MKEYTVIIVGNDIYRVIDDFSATSWGEALLEAGKLVESYQKCTIEPLTIALLGLTEELDSGDNNFNLR